MPQSHLSHAPQLLPDDTPETIVQKALQVRPSKNQLNWHRIGLAAFLHFGVNTYTDREWGDGSEDPAIFNPTEFDGPKIVETLIAGGVGMVILTCKHHDGFCLWPSRYTDHSVASSPYRGGKGDIVRELSDAAHAAGLKFGVYLSPWDRHDARYGDSPAYNDYYINQLTELLTQYGEISDVWLDGACAEGPNGKKQVYDWQRIYQTVRTLAPNATISSMGPDVRWCGNEAGKCRESEWNVVPVAGTDEFLPEYSRQTSEAFTNHNAGELHFCQQPDLGSREKLAQHAARGDRLYWYPAQVDLSIRPGWFYHASEDLCVRSVEQLLEDYIVSVGGNAQLLLNLPPDKSGRLHETDANNLRQLGAILRRTFQDNFLCRLPVRISSQPPAAADALVRDDDSVFTAATGDTLMITAQFERDCTFDLIELVENIAQGQRIEAVEIEAARDGAAWEKIGGCTVVGSKRLIRLPLTTARALKISVTRSRGTPELCHLGVYRLPEMLGAPNISRDDEGLVRIRSRFPAVIRYTTDGSAPDGDSPVYRGAFSLPLGGTVRARADYDQDLVSRAFVVGDGEAGATFGLLKKGWELVSSSGGERAGQGPENLLSSDLSRYVVARGDTYETVIRMDRPYRLTGLLYQPIPSDPDFHYNCTGARVALSMDGSDWEELPETLRFDNIYHNPKLTVCPFEKPRDARYVRVTLGGGLHEGMCAAAELGFLGREPD